MNAIIAQIGELAQSGKRMIERLRRKALLPESRKGLNVRYGIAEAAQLLGCSTHGGGGRVPAALSTPPPATARTGHTLLSRESALARVASGEVRQVTQLLLDPARVRIWPGNTRLCTSVGGNCRELIDSIIAEGGQEVPAIIRAIRPLTMR